MSIVENPLSAERTETDQSLRTEREKADIALAEKHALEEGADQVVDLARQTADAVLLAARNKADEVLAVVAPRAVVIQNRTRDDETLRAERVAADELLRRERVEADAALSRLLPLERDKTDRLLLSERARSDDELAHRDDFLAIVSHDLRNLLGGIVMSAGLLSEDAARSSEGAKLVEGTKRIQRYAARMNRLIGDLVDVASIDAGKLAVLTKPGDANALIAEVVDMFRPAAADKSISLRHEAAKHAVAVEFDHDRLVQVLANLVTNAIKFTPHGGTIRVGCEAAGDELRFCVADTGIGIPSAMLASVFDRFWQVGENDRRGVGLGLYISRCVVEAHRGRIWAESELGKGSKLLFVLPVARP